MAKILLIETSTALCSVALAADGRIKASRRSDENHSHASLTAVFCDEVLKECKLEPKDLDAVCISEGPGSYTGLRVGLSTAKGLCFGARLKLLSVCSLDILAMQGAEAAEESVRYIIPMTDARRMEVYTAVYSHTAGEFPSRITPVEARIINGETLDEKWAEGKSLSELSPKAIFIGDGALKCQSVTGAGRFIEAWPEATAMAALAEREFTQGNWRDVAYFEPFYLKDFVATTSKKKLF